jgi:hypothetical protein
MKWVGLLIIGAACISCSTLKSPHYVGERQPAAEKDLADITVWKQGEDVYFVKRVDSNTLVAATLEWDSTVNDFSVRSFPFIVSKLDDHIFLNVKDGELYSIFRVAGACDDNEPSTFLLFTIDDDIIKQDMADGTIRARNEGDDVIMECTKEDQDAYILENINTMIHMDGACIVRQIAEQKE